MSLRIHICNNDKDASFIENAIHADPRTKDALIKRLTDPKLTIQDHTTNRDHPKLINQAKICLVYED